MIDIKLIREQTDRVKQAVVNKNMKVDIDALLALDGRRRALETEFNTLRSEQNQAGEKIAKAPKEEKAALSAEMGKLKARLKAIEEELASQVEPELQKLMLLVPQIPDPQVPVGKDESGNVERARWGETKSPDQFGFAFQDHLEIGARLGLIDIERGVKLAGSRNYVLSGAAAMLHEAILRLSWELMIERGFTPLVVPMLVTEQLMEGTGYFPVGRDEAYLVERDEKALAGTAEVPVTGLHGGEVLDEADLPKRYIARSTCFRREAGAAGKDTRGLYRLHFFDKLEQVIICKAHQAESDHWHEAIRTNAEDVLKALELPHRILEICTGDMGQGKSRMYDIETWMPSRNAFSETHSASAFKDFQARRLNLRYRRADTGKLEYCWTLNNTVIASPRILIPLLELHQTADGGVTVPKALRPYMGGMERIG